MKQAIEMIEQGNLRGASNLIQPLYDQDTKNAEYNYLLGLIATKQDKYDRALDFLGQAEKLNPDNPRVYETLGEAYGIKAQNAGAIKGALLMPKIKKAFQRALELDSDSLRAREGLFMFYLFVPGVAGGDEKKALQFAEEIAAINKAHGHLAAALVQAKGGKMDQAAVEFEQAVKSAPDDAEVQLKAGRFFLQNKNYEQANKSFNNVLRVKPFDAAGYDALGCVCLAEDKNEKAVEYFTDAIKKNASFFPAIFNRAKALMTLGKNEEARSDLQNILENYSKSVFAPKAKELLSKL